MGQNYNVSMQNSVLTLIADKETATVFPPFIAFDAFAFGESPVGDIEIGAGEAEKGLNNYSQTWEDITQIPEFDCALLGQSASALLFKASFSAALKKGITPVFSLTFIPNPNLDPLSVIAQTTNLERVQVSKIGMSASGSGGKKDTKMILKCKNLKNDEA